MHIYSVNDPEFKSYGNVWDDVPSELTSPVLEALSATPIPEGSKYVASAPELEGVKDADKLGFLMFGGRPFQLGWCNGHNTRLNCLEYHRASEFNPVLAILSCSWRIAGRSRTASSTPRASRRSACRRVRLSRFSTPRFTTRRAWSTKAASSDGGAAGGHQRPAPRGRSRHACHR